MTTKLEADQAEEIAHLHSVMDAWFDQRDLDIEGIGPALIDAAAGYLRVSRVGGMSQQDSDLVLNVIRSMVEDGHLTAPITRYIMTSKNDKLATDEENQNLSPLVG